MTRSLSTKDKKSIINFLLSLNGSVGKFIHPAITRVFVERYDFTDFPFQEFNSNRENRDHIVYCKKSTGVNKLLLSKEAFQDVICSMLSDYSYHHVDKVSFKAFIGKKLLIWKNLSDITQCSEEDQLRIFKEVVNEYKESLLAPNTSRTAKEKAKKRKSNRVGTDKKKELITPNETIGNSREEIVIDLEEPIITEEVYLCDETIGHSKEEEIMNKEEITEFSNSNKNLNIIKEEKYGEITEYSNSVKPPMFSYREEIRIEEDNRADVYLYDDTIGNSSERTFAFTLTPTDDIFNFKPSLQKEIEERNSETLNFQRNTITLNQEQQLKEAQRDQEITRKLNDWAERIERKLNEQNERLERMESTLKKQSDWAERMERKLNEQNDWAKRMERLENQLQLITEMLKQTVGKCDCDCLDCSKCRNKTTN